MTPMKRSLSPSTKRLTEPQIGKIVGSLAAALRKVNPFSVEGQDLIENCWPECEGEVKVALVCAINRILDRRRRNTAAELTDQEVSKARAIAAKVNEVATFLPSATTRNYASDKAKRNFGSRRFLPAANLVPPRTTNRRGANGDDRVGFDLL